MSLSLILNYMLTIIDQNVQPERYSFCSKQNQKKKTKQSEKQCDKNDG